MFLTVTYTEAELRQLVFEDLAKKLGDIPIQVEKVEIQVKSKQNYKAEWETAAFRAVYNYST